VVGPMLVNMSKPVQIVPMNSSASDIVTLGVLASTGVVC
jgi:malate dehydrogenase (oxaloacetate-decarboxylating)(NADP+)